MPFSKEEFLQVFEQYNLGVWPMQVILYGLSAIAFLSLFYNERKKSRIINLILAFFWRRFHPAGVPLCLFRRNKETISSIQLQKRFSWGGRVGIYSLCACYLSDPFKPVRSFLPRQTYLRITLPNRYIYFWYFAFYG